MSISLKPWHWYLFVMAFIVYIATVSLEIYTPRQHVQAQSRAVYGAVISQAPPDLAITQRFDYDGSGNAIYVGYADSGGAGPLSSAAVWAISKITYNGSNQATVISWAGGTTKANKIWDRCGRNQRI